MVYLRARFYEPEMNRFSQKDIIRGSVTEPGSLNRYTYVQNDPINFIDPSGQSFKSFIKSAASKISSAAKTVVSKAKTVVKKVTTAVKTTVNKVKNAAKSAYNKASTAVKNVFNRGTSSSGSSYRGSYGGGSYGASPTGYNPGSSGNSYFSHGSGKRPSPDAPRIKDADEETVKYCKSGPRKATGNNYLLRSLSAFAFGDFSGEKQTLLSLGLGIGAGLLNVDVVLDIRDFVYDVTHISELDNPLLDLTLDVVGLLPVVGSVKYAKYADDVVGIVKHADDVADVAKGVSKAGDAADAVKDVGKASDAAKNANALNGEWKDVNESMSAFSRAYQTQITGKEGKAWVQNKVKFDGMKDGVLIDAKGHYSQFIKKSTGEFYSWYKGSQGFINQAIRQINAADGAKIQWYFAEENTMETVKALFASENITGIELIYEAFK